MAGHDRFIADLRPLLRPLLAGRGLPPALTCHPYDICCALIAEESGVIVTDARGRPLDAPLNVEAEVAWAGYANAHIRAQIEPLLQQALRTRGWSRRERGEPASRRSSTPCGRVACSSEAPRSPCRARPGGSTSWAASPTTQGRSCCSARSRRRHGQPSSDSIVRSWKSSASAGRRARSRWRRWRRPACRSATTRRGGCSQTARSAWAAYVAGVFLVLARERGLPLTAGREDRVASQVPEGKGVSSSAAVETASMHAAAAAFGIALEPRDLALLCQKAENLVAGAPCGVMDQMTCVFGDAQALLALLCQPAELQPPVPVPDDIEFWGIDSGERHAVGGSDYGAVRAGAFMGLRILTEHVVSARRAIWPTSPPRSSSGVA